jgi:DNA-binding transcriptional LysR family regulator
MAKEPNRAAEMAVLVRVVEMGGFSGAARVLGLSASAVSKLVTRLERRLGAVLLRRSTRQLVLTPEGEAFHSRAIEILAEIDAAEREAAAASVPAGRVRLNTSAPYVTHILAPVLPEFLRRYPDITLDIVQSDVVANLLAERSDVAVRAGPLADSGLIARSLGETPLVLVASPDWISRHGQPQSPGEFARQDRIGFAYCRPLGEWLPPSESGGERVFVSDGEGVRRLVLAGVGPARLAGFAIREDLAAGRLVPLLEGQVPSVAEPFHVVYMGRAGTLPARVRVLIDFLAEFGRVS